MIVGLDETAAVIGQRRLIQPGRIGNGKALDAAGQRPGLKGADEEGWARVSKAVMPLMLKMPFELVEVESVGEDGNGRARLTDEGHDVLSAMAWV